MATKAEPTHTEPVVGPPDGQRPPVQRVPVNVWETEHALVAVAPMPGVGVDDVTIALDGGELTLSAELRTPAEKDYRVQEWFYGSFRRSLDVGPGFGGPITATLGNGLLAVSLARRDEPAEGRLETRPVLAGHNGEDG